MLRNIGGVIVGYVLMALIIFLTFTIAYLLMGANNAFEPNTYQVSNLWLVTSFLLAFGAAMMGGYACAAIAGARSRAPIALAVLVIVIGVLAAVPTLRAANAGRDRLTRPAEVSNMEAMQNAVQPGWIAVLNPIIGAGAILLGASLRRRPRS
ncbi:MAG TPA: hypothetical protein VJS44_01205 [Pyrinomonadaceae bacterium]|nr:hypothetical protein [Pyrinomonadaceae bacterium]